MRNLRDAQACDIDPIQSFDLPMIASMHAICFEEAWQVDLLRRILSSPGSFGLFARTDGEPIGFSLCRSVQSEAEMLSFGVVPSRRNFGVGRALLEATIESVQRQSIPAIFLEVAEDNHAARNLYEKYQFTQVGRRPKYYQRQDGPSVDALTLKLTVKSDKSALVVQSTPE